MMLSSGVHSIASSSYASGTPVLPARQTAYSNVRAPRRASLRVRATVAGGKCAMTKLLQHGKHRSENAGPLLQKTI